MNNPSTIDPMRVLYVDDEDDIREIAVFSLELDSGLDVKSCGSGPEALRILEQWLPDLILLDVMMPGMDGPTTLSHIRAVPRLQYIPIAFITARAQSDETQRLLSLGAAGVISKPFDAMQLAQTVRTLIAARP